MAEVTPMMKQYLEVKKKSGDCLLFFRLGDFYEMFFEDAEIASRELELVLTGRDCGLEERAPMCGIPFHAADSYIARLVSKGYKVAVCEQLEDPATAKGIVKRDIIRIYTPGTVTDERMLEQKNNHYIAAVFGCRGLYGLAVADLSTGEMRYTSMTVGSTFVHLTDELAKYAPRELILNADLEEAERLKETARYFANAFVGTLPETAFSPETCREKLLSVCGGKLEKTVPDQAVRAAGALLSYMEDMQKTALAGVISPVYYRISEYMAIDASSRRNLELTETMRDKAKRGSLLWVLDKTATAMGGRLLRQWVEQPLIDQEAITRRLDAVETLLNGFMLRSELREHLQGVYDMERLAGKISLGTVNARDLVSLKQSLRKIPYIRSLLAGAEGGMLAGLSEEMDELPDLCALLDEAIVEDPPIALKDGGVIKDGFDPEIDRCREASRNGKDWLTGLEAREREQTGIKNLKIGYNRVFGYYIEVTKSYLELVPQRYIRKQTLANNERYITEELKEMEDTILGAEDRLTQLEYDCFVRVREAARLQAETLRGTAHAVAVLDALCSLAEVAERENYCRPEITGEPVIEIKDGRHPVIEKMLENGGFVPNDGFLDCGENMLLVITGPNMAGKSTYMRQTALIVLMAQIGSFIPASGARIGIADKIFTRVGASDDLASGQSTFMVEMREVANIIENATERSLLILDEIGRGTSTFDGLSIAWAVLEYIVQSIGCRTMFATHYHELTELEGKMPAVKNYCVDVKKRGDEIIFLRKIKRGGADGSYGIAVASLAGIPKAVTIRAKEILSRLEEQDIGRKEMRAVTKKARNQESDGLDLFAFAANTAMLDDIIEELKGLDVQSMTPIECMNVLYGLQLRAKNRR